eukprot:2184074-Pyramimonas_sp.AAC.1
MHFLVPIYPGSRVHPGCGQGDDDCTRQPREGGRQPFDIICRYIFYPCQEQGVVHVRECNDQGSEGISPGDAEGHGVAPDCFVIDVGPRGALRHVHPQEDFAISKDLPFLEGCRAGLPERPLRE